MQINFMDIILFMSPVGDGNKMIKWAWPTLILEIMSFYFNASPLSHFI